MKIENQNEKFQKEAMELLENAENKSEAILQVIQMAQDVKYEEVINELKKEEEYISQWQWKKRRRKSKK